MATNLTIPTDGLYRAEGDNGDAVYKFAPDGTVYQYGLYSGTGATNNYDANKANLASYGIDWASLPTFNLSDTQQQLLKSGRGGTSGIPLFGDSGGGLASLAGYHDTPTTKTVAINTDPAIQGYVNPNTTNPLTGNYSPTNSTLNPNFNYFQPGQPGNPLPTYNAPTSLNSSSLGSTSTTNFQTPATNNSASNTLNSLYQQSQNPTQLGPQAQKESDLNQLIQSLNLQEAGKSAYQTQQNSAFGVDAAQATKNSLVAQQQRILNEHAAAQLATQSGQGVTTAIDSRQRAEETRQYAIQALSVSSLIAAADGDLANAQLLADKAVAQKFDPIEAQIKASLANLQLIKNDPKTTQEEQDRANAQATLLAAQSAAVAQAKKDFSEIMDIANKAAANGASASVLQKIQSAQTPALALQIAAQAGVAATSKIIGSASTGYYTVDNQGNTTPVTSSSSQTTTSSTSTGYKFTSTQLNSGAVKAGVDASTFQGLSPDVQNFYISASTANLSDLKNAIEQVKSGAVKAIDAKAEIDGLSLAPAVKEYFKAQIDAVTPAASTGGFFSNLWNGITGFFGF